MKVSMNMKQTTQVEVPSPDCHNQRSFFFTSVESIIMAYIGSLCYHFQSVLTVAFIYCGQRCFKSSHVSTSALNFSNISAHFQLLSSPGQRLKMPPNSDEVVLKTNYSNKKSST